MHLGVVPKPHHVVSRHSDTMNTVHCQTGQTVCDTVGGTVDDGHTDPTLRHGGHADPTLRHGCDGNKHRCVRQAATESRWRRTR